MVAEVIGGVGSLKTVVESTEGQDLVILSGATSFRSSGAEQVMRPLLDSGARHLVVNGPLPTVEEVDLLVDEIAADVPGVLIGVGGGLVIDTMKVAALGAITGLGASALLDEPEAPDRSEIRTVAVPTTAGSGAERTPFAVIYRDGVKYSIDDGRLLPSVAVVDPDLTRSVPPNVAAAAALDAMAHCVESMWARRSTSESRSRAAEALTQIVDSIEPAVCDRSVSAQDALMFAASDAGAAIAVTRTTAAHALSYHLTSVYGIPHGHAVALTLGGLASYNEGVDSGSLSDERGVDHVRSAVREVCAIVGVRDGEELTERLRGLIETLGLASDVDSAAGTRVDRRRWAADVNAQRLANNPRSLSEADLLEITEAA